MKKLSYIFLTLTVFAGLMSCDENEAPIYDGSGTPLVSFVDSSVNLEIVIDDNGSVPVSVSVSSLSSEDRTFDLTVNVDETDAPAGSYTVPTSVTIPANSYFGEFTITGTDNNVDTTPTTLTVSFADGVVNSGDLSVSVFQVCPVPSGYLSGQYQLTNLTNTLGIPDFSDDVIDIMEVSEFTRSFDNVVNPFNASSAEVTVTFDLICNEIIFRPFQTNLNLRCTGDANQLSYGPRSNSTAYDPNVAGSDDSLILTYQANVGSTCGGSPNDNAVVLITKI